MAMEQRLCRLCAAITTQPNRVDIFTVDGLQHKIETCLPIHVWKDSELPDSLCTQCHQIVEAFYAFRKRSLETLAIFEAKFHSIRTCFTHAPKTACALKEQATLTDNLAGEHSQFAAWRDKQLGHFCVEAPRQDGRRLCEQIQVHIEQAERILSQRQSADEDGGRLVDYGDSEPEMEMTNMRNKLYFDDTVNDIISEIVERKSSKRKLGELQAAAGRPAKMMRVNSGAGAVVQRVGAQAVNVGVVDAATTTSRRKKRAPMKRAGSAPAVRMDGAGCGVAQVCLLCDQQFASGTMLARHVFETHGIDMAQVLRSEPVPEMLQSAQGKVGGAAPSVGGGASEARKQTKKLPELVKITDLKPKRESMDAKVLVENDAPPTLTASYVCPLCPASLTNKCDLYAHLRMRHMAHAKLICGLCMHIASSTSGLQSHVTSCGKSHSPPGYFICQVCRYSEDNQKSLENHVLVHDFLIGECKKDGKIFDPADFVDANGACDPKLFTCAECAMSFASFKEFSCHKRAEHSIFHCDLCNKSYGRNSHLWKHVNRVHKGHPSVTCQFCYKTSASKYHLLQHFNKIHTQKSSSSGPAMLTASSTIKMRNGDAGLAGDSDEDFMSKKFEGFDFQSVRQSFMRQEIASNKENHAEKRVMVDAGGAPPKELDSSSTIYTNIITNYTPPTNDGEFKCPKCMKAFHKRTLLKKHKKNCRPRLQKDLLTRCKSCSRIFKDRQSLAKHLVNYHSEYACEMCAEKVQSKCEIVAHIRFTHPESHLNCADCGNVLRNNDLLRAHLADHNNSHVCQFCGDILPSKIKLKMHILSLHRKILSLSCGVCLKLFESQHILRDHVRLVHRDALQPLTSCTVCGKNYGSKWKTYDHLNKSHGRVFRACKFCLEVFNNEQELQVHCEAAHTKAGKKAMLMEVTTPPPALQPLIKNGIQQEYKVDEPPKSKSLLMKHLVGDTGSVVVSQTSQSSKSRLSNGTPPKVPKLKLQPLISAARPISPAVSLIMSSEEAALLNNSSKRTVYVNSNDPSRCDICHKNWPAKKHLWQHYIRCHKEEAATVCGICLSTNVSYESLQKHLQREHPSLLHGQGFGSNFICRICGRYHNASSKLRLHMAIHTKFNWGLLEGGHSNEEGKMKVKSENDEIDDEDEDDEEEDEEDEEEDEEDEETSVMEKTAGNDAEVNYESLMEQVEGSTNSSSSSSESDEEEDEEEEEEDEEEEEEEGEEEIHEPVQHDLQTKPQEDAIEVEDEEEVEETVKVEDAHEDTDEDEDDDDFEEVKSNPEMVEAAGENDEEREEDEDAEEEVEPDEEEEDDEDDDEDDDEEDGVQMQEVQERDEVIEEQVIHTDGEVHTMEHVMYDTVEEVVQDAVEIDASGVMITDADEEDLLQAEYIEDDDDEDEEVEEEEEEEEVDEVEENVVYTEDDVPMVSQHLIAETSREFDVRSRNKLNQHEIQSAVDSIL